MITDKAKLSDLTVMTLSREKNCSAFARLSVIICVSDYKILWISHVHLTPLGKFTTCNAIKHMM